MISLHKFNKLFCSVNIYLTIYLNWFFETFIQWVLISLLLPHFVHPLFLEIYLSVDYLVL